MSAWNVYNDLMDIEGDQINHPRRPLASGDVSIETARKIAMFSLVTSIIFTYLVPRSPSHDSLRI